MKMNAIKAAPAASAIALKNEKSAKAKRILIGTDVHLRGYQAARKVDNGVIGVVENFRSEWGDWQPNFLLVRRYFRLEPVG